MRYDLTAIVRRARKTRRALIPLRPIAPPAIRASDLFAIYAPVLAAWRDGLPAILAEYERTLGELTTDAPADASQVVAQVEAQASAIAVAVRLRLEAWAKRLAAWHTARWRANVLSATGVELGAMIGVGDMRMTVEAAVERNAGLVRSVSDETRRRIADSVFRGFDRRAPAREVAAELREAVAMERRRALRVASDQTVKLGAALNEERRREAGISAWAWVSSHKANPRPEHAARDGKLYSDDPGDVGRQEGGRTVSKSPADRPGELIYCGCTSRAVLIL